MADSVTVKVEGLDDLRRALMALPEKLRRKALMGPMRKAMKVVLQAARDAAPVLQAPNPRRTPGTVRKALAVRTSKESRRVGNVGLFVNVRPLNKARAQKAVKKGLVARSVDPFYWKFLEFGTRKMGARPFLKPAGEKLSEALAIFQREAVPAIEALNRPGV